MSVLKEAVNEQGAAKVGLFGEAGSGKTVTGALILAALSKQSHGGAPIAMFDTERGSDFLIPILKAEGIKLLVHKDRSFAGMLQSLRDAEKAGCCGFLADSVTHAWVEIVDSYCKKRNIQRPDFHHWKDIKKQWQEWPDAFLNSPLHCVVNGRSGFEYEYQQNEETGKKELIKGDSKMRTEGQFGYEPHLLIEMERVRDTDGEHVGGRFIHRAHVLKDRSWSLNGKHFDFADRDRYVPGDYMKVFEKFQTHFAFLDIGNHKAVAQGSSEALFDGNGSAYARRAQERTIALEECVATMQLLWPGRTDADKAMRIHILEAVWGTRAWSAVENMHVEDVQAGLRLLRTFEAKAKETKPADEAATIALLELLKTHGTIEGTAPAPLPNNGVTRAVIPNDDIPMPPIQQGLNLPPVPKAEPKPQEDEELAEITFYKKGKDVFLAGSTFPVKDSIKKLGGRFVKDTKEWRVTEDALEELNVICGERNIAVVEHRRHAAA